SIPTITPNQLTREASMAPAPSETRVDRGFPPAASSYDNTAIADAGWRLLSDFETPIPAIDRESHLHNAAVMHRGITAKGAELWPHAKTAMSSELVQLQLEHGSVGMTAATMAQVRALRTWGVTHVMLANQLIQPAAAAWIAE